MKQATEDQIDEIRQTLEGCLGVASINDAFMYLEVVATKALAYERSIQARRAWSDHIELCEICIEQGMPTCREGHKLANEDSKALRDAVGCMHSVVRKIV